MRRSCRSLRDGVDAACTRLTVDMAAPPGQSQLPMLPMAVDSARFRSLRRLDIQLQSTLPIWTDDEGNTDMADKHGPGSHLHLFEPPSWLQELCIAQFSGAGIELFLPPRASMPQLHTLALHHLWLPTTFDCSQFAGLQHLELFGCKGVVNLQNLASCTSLRVLDVSKCQYMDAGLESEVLSQLQQLERLVLINSNVTELDVPSLSPGLTHLDVGEAEIDFPNEYYSGRFDLALPGGAPRTALRHLGLHILDELYSWKLSAVPNLETLDISWMEAVPRVLDLSSVPHLKHLNTAGAYLGALNLSGAGSSLVSLDVSETLLKALNLSGCTVLRKLVIDDARPTD